MSYRDILFCVCSLNCSLNKKGVCVYVTDVYARGVNVNLTPLNRPHAWINLTPQIEAL